MKAAFQGVPGAYSELAARQLLGEKCHTVACETFADVFCAVETGVVERALVPIENSLGGSIHQNYDLLLSQNLHIIGETYLRVEHALLCHPKSHLKKLTEVRSHPQALAQCTHFFHTHAQIKPIAFFDTAGAAKSLLDEASLHIGAIASVLAAELYGLKILQRNLENAVNNYTRFLLLASKPQKIKFDPSHKCSLVLTPKKNTVGVLHQILGEFALREIDLLKIESRPDPRSAFEYHFYLDVHCGKEKKVFEKALLTIEDFAEVKVLGIYPEAKKTFLPKLPRSMKSKTQKN